jgi:protocatechuate 3,4-dioxygenase beta subunit
MISRRQATALGTAAVASVAAGVGGRSHAQSALRPTGQETLGPYYPVRTARGHDMDLTHYPGRPGRAAGQLVEIRGRVLDVRGRPLSGAELLIWQANAAGRYVHANDSNPAPLDPSFLGVTAFRVDREGGFRLRTVKPGAYPEPSGTMRTPHIHWEATNADYRLATQMYFPGETLNATDILLSTLAERRRDPRAAICRAVQSGEPGVLAFAWDIVLVT